MYRSIFPNIYDLDIKKTAELLEGKGNKPLCFTKDDLMYPYMLCLLGRYKEAYDCYKRILSLMVAKNTRSVLNKIKSFCDENPWHREFKDRVWNLL